MTTVRSFFLVLLIAVVIPSGLDLTNVARPGLAWVHLTAVLAMWWLLYVVSSRSQHRPTFIAASIVVVSVAASRSILLGAGMLAVVLLTHIGLTRRHAGRTSSAHTTTSGAGRPPGLTGAADVTEMPRSPGMTITPLTHLEVVDLDSLCRPYGRLLFSLRTMRASVAVLLPVTLFMIPDAFVSPLLDGYEPAAAVIFALVVGIPVTIFAAAVCVLFFLYLRALWRGSVAALWSAFVISVVVIPWALVGLVLDTERGDLVNGRVWFRLTEYAQELVFFIALAIGTSFIVRRRRHLPLLQLLHENGRRTWRAALSPLCGVVWPHSVAPKGFIVGSVGLSVLAFVVEGIGFYPMTQPPVNLIDTAPHVLPALAGPLHPLAAHYLSFVLVICILLPGVFLWAQAMFAVAARIRARAVRIAMTSAEEAMKADERPPVLFLRAFENDQVSLRSAAVPAYVRMLDPAFEQSHLEGVLQTCLSLGPVVAIGRPEDTAPPVGVPRRYVTGEAWQGVVAALMDSASRVVVGASDSAGVAWEIDQLVQRGHTGKTMFIVPPEDSGNHRIAAALLSRLLACRDGVDGGHLAAALGAAIGRGRIVGMACRGDEVATFVSHQRLTQVQYEVALRLGTLAPSQRTPAPS